MKRTIAILVTALVLLATIQSVAVARNRQAKVSAARRPAPATAAQHKRLPVVSPDELDPRADRAHLVESLSRSNPDPRNRSGKLIEISIREQQLTAWHDGVAVMRLVISTGRPGFETPTGNYRVIFKNAKAWSSKWDVWMPWALNWHGNYFIHQLPHYPGSNVNIGASELGRPASHGCVRVNVGDAERLFRWTATGTPVWVH